MTNKYYLNEVNNLAKNDAQLLVTMSEQTYNDQIDELISKFIAKKNCNIILLAGPSSSGKTTTSKIICKKLKNMGYSEVYICLDDFFVNRDKTPKLPNGKPDYENVTALDLEHLDNVLNKLFNYEPVYLPKFNFLDGTRNDEHYYVEMNENTYVVIEGLHAINPIIIKDKADNVFKTYISVNSSFYENEEEVIPNNRLRLMRRMCRDIAKRGKSVNQTIELWPEVRAGEKKFIDPFKNDVEYTIDSTHLCEPLMLAKHLKPQLDKKDANHKQFIEMLDKCSILDANLLSEESVLHEFM